MKIYCKYDELIPPSQLKAHPKNRNKHSADQIARLVKLYKYHGVRHPIIVSKKSGCIVAGHGRREAALACKLKRFPVVYQNFESTQAEYAFLQADNAIALWAELDLKGIKLDLPELEDDFDLELLGIKNFKIDEVGKSGLIDDDAVPKKAPIAKLGDLFQLGQHRLICGDSTKVEIVDRLMVGEKADITFTSPPYNGNTTQMKNGKAEKLYNDYSDDLSSTDYVDFASTVLTNCIEYTSQYVFWNVNYNTNSRSEFIKQILPHIDLLDETICWKKTALPVPRGLTRTWEPIFVFRCHKDVKRLGHTNVTEFNYWDINNQNALDESHRAAFPVALPEKATELVENCGSVFDPFGGSGTTLIAAEKHKKCFMIELDPLYCDVIIARWEKFTGQKAVKDSEKTVKTDGKRKKS